VLAPADYTRQRAYRRTIREMTVSG
jgi:hypothetical protein